MTKTSDLMWFAVYGRNLDTSISNCYVAWQVSCLGMCRVLQEHAAVSPKFIWKQRIMRSFLEEVIFKLSPDEKKAR